MTKLIYIGNSSYVSLHDTSMVQWISRTLKIQEEDLIEQNLGSGCKIKLF